MKESHASKITFDDIPYDTALRMLNLLYDGDWGPFIAINAFALFPVADRFLLHDMREFCQTHEEDSRTFQRRRSPDFNPLL